MRTTTNRLITAAAVIVLLASGLRAEAEQKFQKLTGAQIQTKFTGMELTDEAHWGEVFERNGTLTITSMGHKSTGKWRVQKEQLCMETGNEPGGGCYEVWLAGKNVELRNRSSSVPLEAVLQKPGGAR
jgi:hypothetical protein